MIVNGDISDANIDLMIIGAPKSGTTSLIRYLGQHPSVSSPNNLEMDFFVADSLYENGFQNSLLRFYSFNEESKNNFLFGKSVTIMYLEVALRRLKSHNEEVVVVLVLRNPIDRAYSNYWHSKRTGWEPEARFEDALRADPSRFGDDIRLALSCAYIERSQYIDHIRKIEAIVGAKQLHIFLFEDLINDPINLCHQIYSLIPSLDNSFQPDVDHVYNPSKESRVLPLAKLYSTRTIFPRSKKLLRKLLSDRAIDRFRNMLQGLNERKLKTPPMDPSTREELVDWFRPFNDRLEQHLGRDLSHWNQ